MPLPEQHCHAAQGEVSALIRDLIHSTFASTTPEVPTGGLLQLAAQLSWQDADVDEPLLTLGVDIMAVLKGAADSQLFRGPEPPRDAALAATLPTTILGTFGTAPGQLRCGQRARWSTIWRACDYGLCSGRR
jgi:hypothetical protein